MPGSQQRERCGSLPLTSILHGQPINLTALMMDNKKALPENVTETIPGSASLTTNSYFPELPTVSLERFFSTVFLPIPLTLARSSMLLK